MILCTAPQKKHRNSENKAIVKANNLREQGNIVELIEIVDGIESIEAFCLTICRNLALDRMRHLENQNQSLEEGDHDKADQSYASNPEEQAMQRDRIELIRQLINELPEKQRSAMQLREFEGKSYKEIASIMAVSEEQVKVNIFRARQAIRQKYIETEKYGL